MMLHMLTLALVLDLHNFAGAAPAIVRDAEREVTRVYQDIGAAAVFLFCTVAYLGREKLTPGLLVQLATGSALITPFILPAMRRGQP